MRQIYFVTILTCPTTDRIQIYNKNPCLPQIENLFKKRAQTFFQFYFKKNEHKLFEQKKKCTTFLSLFVSDECRTGEPQKNINEYRNGEFYNLRIEKSFGIILKMVATKTNFDIQFGYINLRPFQITQPTYLFSVIHSSNEREFL